MAAIARLGFYPLPDTALDSVVKLFKPADFDGGMILDPCAGNGDALQALSQAWNLKPYANELNKDRAAKCEAKFGTLNTINGDSFDLETTGHYNVVYLNPPFQNNGESNGGGYYGSRAEFDFLKQFWGEVLAEQYLIFVCYTQHLMNNIDMCESIYEHSDQVDVYRVPGHDLDAYQMIVLVCKVRRNRREIRAVDKENAALLQQRAEFNWQMSKFALENGWAALSPEQWAGMFTDITTITEPPYALKNPHFNKRFKPMFSSRRLSNERVTELIQQYGAHHDPITKVFVPVPQRRERKVVIMPRFRQIAGLLASGIFNGAVIQTANGPIIVRAVTTQVEKKISDTTQKVEHTFDPDEESDYEGMIYDIPEEYEAPKKDKAGVIVYQTRPETVVTIMDSMGEITRITDDGALNRFIREYKQQLMEYINTSFRADYHFDYINEDVKATLNSLRVRKGKKLHPLFTTQKHVAAATFAHLINNKGMTLCGEMGVGKTVMGAGVLELFRKHSNLIDRKSRMKPGQFNVIICPPHLVDKWANEIEGSLSNVYLGLVKSGEGEKPINAVMDFIRGMKGLSDDVLKILIISREMGKSGETVVPAFRKKTKIEKGSRLYNYETGKYRKLYIDSEIMVGAESGYQILKPGSGTKKSPKVLTENDLRKNHLFMGIDRKQKKYEKPIRGAKITQYPGSGKLVEEMTEYVANYMKRGMVDRAERTASDYRERIRKARREHDYAQPRHEPLWQEARSFSAMAVEPGDALRMKLGTGHRIMPLPDICEKHLQYTEWHNAKSVRAPARGVIDFLIRQYGDLVYCFIMDEAHEVEGFGSAQAMMAMSLAMKATKVIYMTGTVYRGVASSLYNIEFAINPRTRYDYVWGDKQPWIEKMGAIERIVKINDEDGKGSGKKSQTEQVHEIPGASPELLSYIIDHTLFVGITDLGNILPPFVEVGTPVQMDDMLADIYKQEIEGAMRAYLKSRIENHDNSFMSVFFQVSLNYPNWPYEPLEVWHKRWVENPETGEKEKHPVLVTTLPGLGMDYVTNKEKALIEQVKASITANRGVAVYFRQTGRDIKRPNKDILGRFQNLIRKEVSGAKVAVLKASVGAGKREAWLAKQKAAGVNVLLCNPELVKTGLDMIEYPDILWYELSYTLPTIEQASHRAWRPGQDKECRVNYLFYVDAINEQGQFNIFSTMEGKGVNRIDAKRSASAFLKGEEGATLTSNPGSEKLEDEVMNGLEDVAIVDSSQMFKQAVELEAEQQSQWVDEESTPTGVTVEEIPGFMGTGVDTGEGQYYYHAESDSAVFMTDAEREACQEDVMPMTDEEVAAWNAKQAEKPEVIETEKLSVATKTSEFCPGVSGFGSPAYKYLRKTDKIPGLGETDGTPIEELKVAVKLFNPEGADTWYVMEYNAETQVATCFWVAGDEYNTINVNMAEFAELRTSRFHLPMERDLHFDRGCTLLEALRREQHYAAMSAFEAYLPKNEVPDEQPVRHVAEEMAVAEPIINKTLPLTDLKKHWAYDVKRYGKPTVDGVLAVFVIDVSKNMRVIYEKDHTGTKCWRQSIQAGEIVYNVLYQ